MYHLPFGMQLVPRTRRAVHVDMLHVWAQCRSPVQMLFASEHSRIGDRGAVAISRLIGNRLVGSVHMKGTVLTRLYVIANNAWSCQQCWGRVAVCTYVCLHMCVCESLRVCERVVSAGVYNFIGPAALKVCPFFN